MVIDPTINEEMMEMYADKDSRGGILEPPGICEVKFRSGDQIAAMHRYAPSLRFVRVPCPPFQLKLKSLSRSGCVCT